MGKRKIISVFTVVLIITTLLAIRDHYSPSHFSSMFFSVSAFAFTFSGIRVFDAFYAEGGKTKVSTGITIATEHLVPAVICLLLSVALSSSIFYSGLTRLNIAPTVFVAVYEEDNIFEAEESFTVPFGSFSAEVREDGSYELKMKNHVTGEYESGAIEVSMGRPTTLGECMDLQIECWRDEYENRKVYYREEKQDI